MKKISVVFSILVLISVSSFAENYSDWGVITYSEMTSEGGIMVEITGNKINPDSCISKEFYAVGINYLPMIIFAQDKQKEVRFILKGCSGKHGKYPKIVGIQVKS